MEAAEEAGFCDSAVRFINYCRIYLNVISLADITDESGMTIDSRVLKQKEIPQRDEDSGLIRQKKPDCTKWSIWFKFLKTLLRPRQSKLKVPLGAWTAGYSTIRKKFKSYRTEDKLYRVQNGIIAEHMLTKRLGKEWISQDYINIDAIPEHAIPGLSSYFGWMYTPYNISNMNQVEERRPLVGALFLKGNSITGNIIKELRQSIQQQIIQEHYQHIFGEAYPHIVWEVLQLTIKKSHFTPSLLKMVHNICPTQAYKVKLKLTPHSHCPCCTQSPEDIHHVLTCPKRESLSRFRFIQEIQKSLKIDESHQPLMHQIFDSVAYKRNCISTDNPFSVQNQIGWDKILRGFITNEWESITSSLNQKGKWTKTMSLIISTLWKIWKEMWTHRNNSIDPLSRYQAQIQYNTNILKLQIIYSLKANFPERMKQMLDSSFEEHCLQPQNEVTEWLNMYCKIFQTFVDSHREGLWQDMAEYWININRTSE